MLLSKGIPFINYKSKIYTMKIILNLLVGVVYVISSAFMSDITSLADVKCLAMSGSTCIDERPCGIDEEVWTFACASDICNNSPETECYICITCPPDEICEN